MSHLLSLITFFPLLGVLAMLFVPKDKETWPRWIAVGATAVPLLLALYLFQVYDRSATGLQFVEQFRWIPSLNIEYFMGADGISILMLLLAPMLSFLGVFASWNIKKMPRGYFSLYLLLHVGMLGVFCAMDFFLFYVFWEVMLLPMYFLVGIWGGERKEYAAIKFFLYTFFGSVLMLVAMLAMYFYSTGPGGALPPTFNIIQLASMDWSQYSINLFGMSLPFDQTIWWLLFMGFAIKVPIFPFHTWLPWAHVQAPTAVSVILAGVLLKMGPYGFLRFNYSLLPDATNKFAYAFLILGIINIIYGALCAMAQKDLKKLVAYSSVSHMGYVIMGMAAMTPVALNGAVLQLFNHGLSAAMMFMLVGVLYDRLHHRYLVTPDGRLGFGGIAQRAPIITAVWTIAIFASLGLPGLNGFISEAMVFLGTFPVYKTETIIAAIGIVLGAAYLLWMAQRVFLGPFTTLVKNASGQLEEAGENALPPLKLNEWVVLLPLGVLCLVLGVYPQPMLDLMRTGLDGLLQVLR